MTGSIMATAGVLAPQHYTQRASLREHNTLYRCLHMVFTCFYCKNRQAQCPRISQDIKGYPRISQDVHFAIDSQPSSLSVITLSLSTCCNRVVSMAAPLSWDWPTIWPIRQPVSELDDCHLKLYKRAKPYGTAEGEGIYLTVYPKSSPNSNTDSILF